MTVLLLLLLAQAAPESHTLEELRRAAAASRLQDDASAAEQSLLEAARELWTRAIGACDNSLPPESPQCLAALEALAGSMRDESEYAEAEPLYLRSLALRQAAFGRDSAELISTLDSLAYVQFGQKKY